MLLPGPSVTSWCRRRRVSRFPNPEELAIHQGFPPASSQFSHEIALVSTKFLLFFDDMTLLQSGAMTGYYPNDSGQLILDSMHEKYPRLGSLASALQDLSTSVALQIFRYRVLTRSSTVTKDFLPTVQAEWHDTKTPEFRTCVQLLLFSDDRTWDIYSERLGQLAARLTADPSLSMRPDDVDYFSWALRGTASTGRR